MRVEPGVANRVTSSFARLGISQKLVILELGLFGVALLLRLLAIMWLAPSEGDQLEYLGGAQRLLEGEPLPQKNHMLFVRAPGYSIFIALVWLITGTRSLLSVKLAQVVFSTATCWYVHAMAKQVSPSRRWALIPLAAAAGYPYLVYYAACIGTEAVFAFLLAAGIYHLGKGLNDKVVLSQVFLGGVLLGCGNLVRPNLSTMIPLLAMWIIVRWLRNPLLILRIGTALAIPIFALSLTWTYVVHKRDLGLIWISDGGGIWYYAGHFDGALKLYGCAPATTEELRALLPGKFMMEGPVHDRARLLPPPKQQGEFWRTGLEWDRRNLDHQACLALRKFVAYWRPWVNSLGYSRTYVLLSTITSLPVLLGGLTGLIIALRRKERVLAMLVLASIVSSTVVAMIFSTEIRYRIPLVDLLLLPFLGISFAALYRFVSRLMHSRSPRTRAPRLDDSSSHLPA